MATTLVYIGTYTHPEGHVRESKGQGIYTYELDPATGKLTYHALTGGIENPSYLALDSGHRYLYAVAEVSSWTEGQCFAYRVDPTDGALTYINQQSTLGGAACYVTVDHANRCVLVANYGGPIGVVAFPIREDGGIAPASSSATHQGSGPVTSRQQEPHAHCAVPDATNHYVFVPDLGIDKLMGYKFDSATGQLTPNTTPSVSLAPGGGPRHFVFHPNGKFAYVIQELSSTITALAYDGDNGSLQVLQTISTLPPNYAGESSCAALQIHASGKFLYGSNRGHNSIAAFAVDEQTGKLTPVGHQSTQGDTPRDFAIDPTGTYLLAANQDSDTVVTFKIDPTSGGLQETGQVADIPTPVRLKMIQL
ncbi:MAG: lactonase family protein [Anaerolineae bacterium]|nr:lactonase family protein [Anaerolineae bacterium]